MHVPTINRRAGILALTLLAAPALTGCTSNNSSASHSSSSRSISPAGASTPGSAQTGQTITTSGVTATAAPTGVAALALTAYISMWNDYVHASNAGEFPDLTLAHYADGSAFTILSQGLAKNHSAGVITKGNPHFAPKVTQLYPSNSPTQVVITDCFDDSAWLTYLQATGKLQDSTPGGLHKVEAVVTETYGVWLVNQLAVQGVGTCTR